MYKRSGASKSRALLDTAVKMLSWTTLLLTTATIGSAYGTPVELARRATPTVYLAGDSTMAKTGNGLMGWGEYLAQYLTLPVSNHAVAGRSARSYTAEGRFADIAALLQPDDIVVIEFGHNDGGSPTSASDNGRSDCPGTGTTATCTSGKTGETVHTFNYYVEAAAKSFIAKGAKVVFSSQTPNNLFETGKFVYGVPRFVGYAATAAKDVGAGASFVDHFQAVADLFLKLGATKTNALYPQDHTHTSPAGADLVAQAFVEAVAKAWNGTTPLKSYVKSPAPSVF